MSFFVEMFETFMEVGGSTARFFDDGVRIKRR